MTEKKIGVVFPGYGEQYIGMCKDFYDEYRTVQELFEQAAGTAEINFVKLMFASSDQEISEIIPGYLSIYLFQAAVYEILQLQGLKPDFLAGYGIGEYAAAYGSGSLSFIDGLYILNKYAQFYQDFVKSQPYTVLRIIREFDVESIEELCEKKSTKKMQAYVASQNTKQAFYVAGHEKIIEKIQQYCIKEVIRKVRIIGPAYGMHSSLEDVVAEQLKIYFHKIQFKNLSVPVITNVDGVYVTTSAALESAIIRKNNHRNQWLEVMQGFEGCDVILSVGPGTQLLEWFKQEYPDKEYHMISTLKDLALIAHLYKKTESAVEQKNVESIQEGQTLYDADVINEKSSDFDIEDEE